MRWRDSAGLAGSRRPQRVVAAAPMSHEAFAAAMDGYRTAATQLFGVPESVHEVCWRRPCLGCVVFCVMAVAHARMQMPHGVKSAAHALAALRRS